ncbi:alpha/beta fold hydrolase [Telmatospirillum siberiense]|uniref:Alpha/beta hydrolase n=1 Tax=Telmatospirillum siberiense TaxID=382514 RepID=A0A2N3PSX8_9PROT|nr:alpha/beta fold hydrolase [Telmatospirillum siberiense]PKU23502.1 alpha/beta hydrolase [Telmatospirillum siberiense]
MRLREFEIDVLGIPARCWEGGHGFPLLLLHGSGAGAASLGTWAHVFEALTARYHVYASDLIGFGRSGRKTQAPFFDMALWEAQLDALLAVVPEEEVGVVGHSLSGALALRLAARERRITRVITTATMGWSFAETPHTQRCWTFPETRDDLRKTMEALTFDHAGITESLLDDRMSLLHDGVYGPYFRAMFHGDKQRYIDEAAVPIADLARIACPVLMIHGRNDLLFPAEGTTLPLSAHLPRATVLLLPGCGHLPALEHPGILSDQIISFLSR